MASEKGATNFCQTLLFLYIPLPGSIHLSGKEVPSAYRYIGLVAAHHDLLAISYDLAVADTGVEMGSSSAPADCRYFFDIICNLHKSF